MPGEPLNLLLKKEENSVFRGGGGGGGFPYVELSECSPMCLLGGYLLFYVGLAVYKFCPGYLVLELDVNSCGSVANTSI